MLRLDEEARLVSLTTCASRPTPPSWTKYFPFALGRSTRRTFVSSMMSQQRWRLCNGKPSSIAKTFTVPIGSTPNVALLPTSPFATWLTVPSPPAATIRVNPASTARLASASASPECAVTRTGQSPASDSTRSCQLRMCSGLPAVGLRMTIVSVTRKSSRGLSPFLQTRTA